MGSSIRGLASVAMSVGVTFSLFFLMYSLVANKDGIDKAAGDNVSIIFGRVRLQDELKVKKREIPKKPPPPKDPPPPPKMAVQNVEKQISPMPQMRVPNLSLGVGGSGPYLGGSFGADMNADGDIIPIVRIPPQFPRKALLARIEGYVTLEFIINETGSVEDVTIVKSQPPRIFDRAATKALYKWKFKPRIIDGVPQKRRATQTLDFNFEEEG